MLLSRLSAVSVQRPSVARWSAGMASAALAALLAGCAAPKPVDETAKWSPNQLYNEALDERSVGNYDKAISHFEKLEGRAAGTPLAQQAQLDKAYTHYKNGEQAQAIATIDRFLKLHPASPALDYALYLRGLANFNDSLGLFGSWVQQDLAERDQKAAKVSFESFKELTERFPDSRYAPDARARMVHIVNALAMSEVHVARYYYQRGAYVAAVNRAQTAIAEYREAPALEEALHLLVQSYDALGMTDLSADARRVLEKNFPQSAYLGHKGSTESSASWWRKWW